MVAFNTSQVLNDISHNFGQDLSFSATGDLMPVSGSARGQQRILRRLFTNTPNYIWHANYGAGLPNAVGQALTNDFFDQIKSLITSQIFLEQSVAQSPQPKIYLQTIQKGLFCQIEYTDNPSKEAIVFTFDV